MRNNHRSEKTNDAMYESKELSKAAAQADILCISIATTGKDHHKDKITSVATGTLNHSPIVYDMINNKPEDIMTLKQLLEDDTEKIFFDAKNALNFFHAAGFEINGPIYDVMLMDKILRAGEKKKNSTIDDIIRKYVVTTIDSTAIPVVKEAEMLPKLYEAILSHLAENDLVDTAVLEFECIRAVAAMERNGIRVNREKLLEMLQEFTRQKDVHEEMLRQDLGDINLNSHKQVKEALIKKGIIVNDTRQDTLHPHIFPHLYLWDYQIYKKSQYYRSQAAALLKKINSVTGRLYPKYSQIGAPNGRLSCSEPNLHAIPKTEEFRSCFIPDDCYKLIIADYSQIELRIAAEISHDERMVDAYKRGYDLHKLTASLIMGESMDSVTKNNCLIAKAVNYGLIYMMDAEELSEFSVNNYGVSISLQEAQKFISVFFSAYQGIAQWYEKIDFYSCGETRTLGNRRRVWNGYYINTTDLLKTTVQGTTADILKRALCVLHERIKNTGIKVIGCIHREILMEAPINETDAATQIIRESMTEAAQQYLKEVPVVIDVSAVDNWYEKQE